MAISTRSVATPQKPALNSCPMVVNWRPWIDTALDPPQEIYEWKTAIPVMGGTYHAGVRSVVVLIAGEEVNGCTAQ